MEKHVHDNLNNCNKLAGGFQDTENSHCRKRILQVYTEKGKCRLYRIKVNNVGKHLVTICGDYIHLDIFTTIFILEFYMFQITAEGGESR